MRTETKKNVVVFSGAGISAESGLRTFRDSDGLWEEYEIEDVATPEAWEKNQEFVLDFYNQRRKQILDADPNPGHLALTLLEETYNVTIVTQNIDNLHERAGSTNVLHLHGNIFESRSTIDENLVYPIDGWKLDTGSKCAKNSQLRPNIVWFGEEVPNMDKAIEVAKTADILIIVGTSLNVYPAAGIVHFVSEKCDKYLVDPGQIQVSDLANLSIMRENASSGLPRLSKELLAAAILV
jgi:NAD-dependent deacetylase